MRRSRQGQAQRSNGPPVVLFPSLAGTILESTPKVDPTNTKEVGVSQRWKKWRRKEATQTRALTDGPQVTWLNVPMWLAAGQVQTLTKRVKQLGAETGGSHSQPSFRAQPTHHIFSRI